MVLSKKYGAIIAAVSLLTLTACGSSPETNKASNLPQASQGSAQDLRGVCPDKIVIQKDWAPEAEHGSLYNLLGSNYTIDSSKKSISGSLVTDGVDTGVKLEIRSGGKLSTYPNVPAAMYADKSITLGYIATDEAIKFYKDQPTLSVVAPMEISPLALLWDAKNHPEIRTINDLGQTDIKVLYFSGHAYMDYLVGTGILRKSQIDSSYAGSPDRFVGSGGQFATQGFITSEPYNYEHDTKNWNRPLTGQLVNDTKYPAYFNTLAIRKGDKETLSPCLKKLVPIIQKSQVNFIKSPQKTLDLIVETVKKFNSFWTYSPELAKYSTEQLKKQGIVGNGNNQTLGDFEDARIARIIEIQKTVKPIDAQSSINAPAGLKSTDIYTNEYIDPKISLD